MGYATQAGSLFSAVMSRAEVLLSRCSCSSSCDKCLRHYGNRFHHSTLDRFLALDLLRFIRDGILPDQPSAAEQRNALQPLLDMMQLAGWVQVHTSSAPVAVSSDGRLVQLFSYPSLISPEHYGFVRATDTYAFTSYELSRDLPGAFGVIV